MSNYKSIKALFLGSNIKSSIIQEYSKINQLKKISEGYFCTDIKIKEQKYFLYFKEVNFNLNDSSIEDHIEEYLNNFDIIFLVYNKNEKHSIRLIEEIWTILEKKDNKLDTRYKVLLCGKQKKKSILGSIFKKEPKKKHRKSAIKFMEEKDIDDCGIINVDNITDVYDEINKLLTNYIDNKGIKKVVKNFNIKEEPNNSFSCKCLIQ